MHYNYELKKCWFKAPSGKAKTRCVEIVAWSCFFYATNGNFLS